MATEVVGMAVTILKLGMEGAISDLASNSGMLKMAPRMRAKVLQFHRADHVVKVGYLYYKIKWETRLRRSTSTAGSGPVQHPLISVSI